MGKKKCPEFENHERWLVSYADMMTLLFCLFVVLYALSNTSRPDKKIDQVAAAAVEVFADSLQDLPVDKRAGPKEQGFGIFENFKGDQARPSMMKKFPDSQKKSKVIEDEIKILKMKLEDPVPGERRSPKDASVGSERIVSVQKTDEGIVIRLLASHFYKAGEYRVGRNALVEIDKLASALKDLGRPISVEGHTDSLPPTEGEFGNWELSAMRAAWVVKYITTKFDFPLKDISASGWADAKPIAHNGTAEGRALNRRVEIKIKYE
ncbi:MAG: flagellar motor protein MotB [Pseudomonadota bacterium]